MLCHVKITFISKVIKALVKRTTVHQSKLHFFSLPQLH